jgi:Fe-S-cluster containining protein
MLADGGCSIYEHRPRTCRTYDCRIFPATGLAVDEGDPAKADIARQARRWRFTFPADEDRRCHDAVRAAAVAHNRAEADARPATVTQVAVRAIETYEEFL